MSQACPERGGAASAWAHLETRDAALAERVRCADTSALEVVESRRGARTLRQGGVQLASPYDPQREAEQVVAGVEPGNSGTGRELDGLLKERRLHVMPFRQPVV